MRILKRFFLCLTIILICSGATAFAEVIGDGGTLSSPTFVAMRNTKIDSERVNVRIKDGIISLQFSYNLNSTSGGSKIILTLPKQAARGLSMKMDKKTIGYYSTSRQNILSLYPNSKLPKASNFNVWQIYVGKGSKHSITFTYNEKYTKGQNLSFIISEELNNRDKTSASSKVALETEKLNIADIGNLYVGDVSKTPVSTNKTGIATWTSKGTRAKITIKYKSTKEELAVVFGKSIKKYPKNIRAAIITGDYKTLQILSNKYISTPLLQDSNLNIGYVKYALSEAAFDMKDFATFDKVTLTPNFMSLGSDQLTSRMAAKVLQSSQANGNKTAAEGMLQDYKTAKPAEFNRMSTSLVDAGLIDKAGNYVATAKVSKGNNGSEVEAVTGIPTPVVALNAKDGEKITDNSILNMIKTFFSKFKIVSLVGLMIAFIIGILIGFFFAKRKYGSSSRRNQHVVIR